MVALHAYRSGLATGIERTRGFVDGQPIGQAALAFDNPQHSIKSWCAVRTRRAGLAQWACTNACVKSRCSGSLGRSGRTRSSTRLVWLVLRMLAERVPSLVGEHPLPDLGLGKGRAILVHEPAVGVGTHHVGYRSRWYRRRVGASRLRSRSSFDQARFLRSRWAV